jgi:cytochrome c553
MGQQARIPGPVVAVIPDQEVLKGHMRKVALILLCILVVVGMASAQTYTSGSGATGLDVLGAHNNYGRGCAGCHAPHNGAKGSGGNAATNAAAFNDPYSGTNALFAQDVTPLYSQTFTFAGGYLEPLPSAAAAYTTNEDELRGIMMCLACHDGLIAKGGMMQGVAWEQAYGVLPGGVYGPNNIPTFLDSATVGYQAQHPVGVNANLNHLRLVASFNGTSNTWSNGLEVTVTNGAISNIIAAPGTAYASFAANYGYPAIAGSPWEWGVHLPTGSSNPADAFITCTTCHNQHVMYIYQAPRGKMADSKIGGGTYPTYWFINAPYNPGTAQTKTTAASATQFCRQCHFGEANEAYGVTSVQTQF